MEKKHIQDLMLIQPDNVTFGQFSVTATQDNILTLINEQLQDYMTNKKSIMFDLLGQPFVHIRCDEAGGLRNKSKVKKEAIELSKKLFRFRWVHPKIHRTYETAGVIVTSVHDDIGTNNLIINFNPWAIPFLLYYGKGVGGTFYKKTIALSLRGDKAKRMYKIICSKFNEPNGTYDYSLEQLRQDFQLGPSYTNAIIKKRILEASRDEIKASGADVWFDFELITKHPKNNKRKPMADTARLHIKTTRTTTEGSSQTLINGTIYRWLQITLEDAFYTDEAFKAILQSERREEIYNRICFWDDKLSTGEMTTQHIKNSIRKMLKEDFPNVKLK